VSGGAELVVPMNLKAHKILSAIKGTPGERIFPGRD
jgi:hypothetical protein